MKRDYHLEHIQKEKSVDLKRQARFKTITLCCLHGTPLNINNKQAESKGIGKDEIRKC